MLLTLAMYKDVILDDDDTLQAVHEEVINAVFGVEFEKFLTLLIQQKMEEAVAAVEGRETVTALQVVPQLLGSRDRVHVVNPAVALF